MNQKQREYLVDQVTKTYKSQTERLEAKLPKKPKLNNYLLSAFLDGTVQFTDLSHMKGKLRERVLKGGADEAIIEEKDEDDYSFNRRRKKDIRQLVTLEAEDIFVLPQEYLDAVKKWEEDSAKLNKEIDALSATHKTIVMKIQIGSDKALDKLIEQADNLADLNLVSAQLTISGSDAKLLDK